MKVDKYKFVFLLGEGRRC